MKSRTFIAGNDPANSAAPKAMALLVRQRAVQRGMSSLARCYVQLYDKVTREEYLIGSGFNAPDSMNISSHSPCSTHPEGTWSSGEF